MPEYLAPGVYLEEREGRSRPIPGVSASTLGLIAQSLGSELRGIVPGIELGWTEGNVPDPGITLLELIAWLSEAVVYRSDTIPEQGRKAAMRALAALSPLAESCRETEGPIRRPSFFAGQVLDEKTLQAEQDYHREMQRRHNLELHGVGIVHGLGVRVEVSTDAEGGRLRIEPGYAHDRYGRAIVLGQAAMLALPKACEQVYVSLRLWEIPCAPVPSRSGEPVFSRIEEACVVAFVDIVAEPAIALARLLHFEGEWTVDPSFVPERASRGST